MRRQTWREAKRRRSRAEVEPYLRLLLAQFATGNPDVAPDVHVVGSWRRGADPVGDLDVVLVTRTGEMTANLLAPGVRLPALVDWNRHGARQAHRSIRLDDGSDLYLDVWCCGRDELGQHLVFATGLEQLNKAMRAHCKRNGKALSQRGVYDRESRARLGDGSERGVFEAAGWQWLDPTERQRWTGGRNGDSDVEGRREV